MHLCILQAGLWFAVFIRLTFQRTASQIFRKKCCGVEWSVEKENILTKKM